MSLGLFPRAACTARARAKIALIASLGLAACAPKAAVAPRSAEPAPGPVPGVMRRCPDESDGPSIVANAIEDAHRAVSRDPSAQLPPACVVTAFARMPQVVPESLDTHALALATELERRGADARELIAGEMAIRARRRQFTELWSAYVRLTAVDSQPAIDVLRLAASAARARGDSASLMAILAKGSARADATTTMRNEYAVLQRVSALATAINQARGFIRQNPKYVAAYPSLVANFGTLGLADSVAAYTRRGLTNGATPAALTPVLESLVNTLLRHASLYSSVFDWNAAIAGAERVDAALPSAATKFLIASLIVKSAGPRIAEADALVNGLSWWPSREAGSAAPGAAATRADGCARAGALNAALDVAQRSLGQGGDRFPNGGPELVAPYATARGLVESIIAVCGK